VFVIFSVTEEQKYTMTAGGAVDLPAATNPPPAPPSDNDLICCCQLSAGSCQPISQQL